MFPRTAPLPAVLTALALLLAPAPGVADAVLVSGAGKASATLNFRLVIPPVMQVLENSHPAQVGAAQGAEQRLVVLSNLRNGFCATLRLTDPNIAGWQLDTVGEDGVSLQAVAEGYRLCASRPGRYALRLQHEFRRTGGDATALPWPVQTELVAL